MTHSSSALSMDKFLKRQQVPGKRKVDDESTSNITTTTKRRKYDEAYLALRFTSTLVGDEERPQCVVCLKILASDNMKPNKLRRDLEMSHHEHKDKPVDFFRNSAKQSRFTKAASVPSNAQLASYKVAYRVAQCKKLHTIAEELILPSVPLYIRWP